MDRGVRKRKPLLPRLLLPLRRKARPRACLYL
jgi:hypothetical protein